MRSCTVRVRPICRPCARAGRTRASRMRSPARAKVVRSQSASSALGPRGPASAALPEVEAGDGVGAGVGEGARRAARSASSTSAAGRPSTSGPTPSSRVASSFTRVMVPSSSTPMTPSPTLCSSAWRDWCSPAISSGPAP
ncbi:hypothetical protein ACFFX0_13800 [Citricoccus parietis]|uniref:Uncharacterized protein n=1 Tax=Citricoccus parietis TaxID=592307 RepID=A0ABV5FZU4_9MICC